MAKNIKNTVLEYFKGRTQFTSNDLGEVLQKLYPEAAPKTISWRIYDLKSKGVINHIGRDIYTINQKPHFSPSISPYLKRIYNKISKELPFVKFCVWDSRWLNELMLHQIFKFYLVIETEKDSMESVFNCLTDFSKKVYLNPDKEIFERYISGFDEVIIVKSFISEAPLSKKENTQIASLEKLLVDILIDTDLFSAQQGEVRFIFASAFEKYSINMNKLKRYARRRDQLKEIASYIPTHL